ncbi:MAG: IS3 family transposase [Candidatus Micrarchaeota archaeon]
MIPMFYETIKEEKRSIALRPACRALGVSRSGYLDWEKRKPRQTSAEDQKILSHMQSIAEEFGYYGYRRITKALRRQGVVVNHKRVLRMMRENSLTIKMKKFKPRTTDSSHSLPSFPNLAKGLVVDHINQLWVADITYVPLDDIFLYLALLMDVFSRKIVGWQLGRNIDTELCLDALKRAFASRRGMDLGGLIHHSDHGSQYLSKEYISQLKNRGIQSSTGETGVAYDNAFAEAVNKLVKYDEVYRSKYESFEDAYLGIKKYVGVYNKKRLHSGIGYLPPDEFEKALKNSLI